MYDRNNEFNTFFDELNIEDNASEMTRIRKTTKRKARIHHVAVAGRNVACVVAGLSLITFAGVKTSPAFADALSKLPIISEWIGGAKKDEGIQQALENDCETIVNQTAKFETGELTLSYVVADEADIVFSFTGSLNEGYDEATLEDIKITDLGNGKEQEYGEMFMLFDEGKPDHEIFELTEWLYSEEDPWSFPEEIKLDAILIVHSSDYSDVKEEKVSYEIKLNKPLPPKEYTINKEIEIMDQKLTITKAVMYPTCTNIYYIYDSNNSMDLMYGSSFSIKTSDGKVLSDKSESVHYYRDSEEDFQTIKSGYYTVSGGFEIILDEARLLPKTMRNVELDVKTMTLTDETGIVKRAFIPSKEQLEDECYELLRNSENDILIQIDSQSDNTMYSFFDYQEEYEGLDYNDSQLKSMQTDLTPDDDSDIETGFSLISEKVVAADEDGIIHLERNFPEYYVTPDLNVFTLR